MTLDRLFLDADILFLVAYGSPGLRRFWELVGKKRCELFVSHYVVEEARRNLFRPEDLKRLKSCLSSVSVVPEVDLDLPCPVALPEKDRPVLLAAMSVRANHLITDDATHFGRYFGKTVSGVRICRPRDYFQLQPRRSKKKSKA